MTKTDMKFFPHGAYNLGCRRGWPCIKQTGKVYSTLDIYKCFRER